MPVPLTGFAGPPLLGVTIAVIVLGSRGYHAVQESFPGTATAMTSGLLQALALAGCAYAAGAWMFRACLVPRTGRGRLRLGVGRELWPARRAAVVWATAATLLIAVDAADAAGLPLSRLTGPAALSYLVQANYLPRAWMVTAGCAWLIVLVTTLTTRWETTIAIGALVAIGAAAPIVVTHVLVGPNHDFGSDAAFFGTPAFVLATGLIAAWATSKERWTLDPVVTRRMRTTALVAGAAVVASDAIIGWFEMPGSPPWSSATGWLLMIKDALLIAAIALVVRTSGRVWARHAAALAAGGALAASAISFRIPPPQYHVPTTISQNFLGYAVSAPPTLWALATQWRLDILFAVLSATAAGLYVAGVAKLRRSGRVWPTGRVVAWLAGCAVIGLSMSSGVGRYADATFSVHMAVHMTINMAGPLLLVLGGPLTLALAATDHHPRGAPAGPREWLRAWARSGLRRWMYQPLEVFAVFVGSYYVFYFTPIFQDSMRIHWIHQVAYLDFVLAGYLFFALVIGIDRPPRALPPLGRLGMVLAAMPFHAFFGVLVMTHGSLIAGTFYHYLDQPWMTDLHGDQYTGGVIAWVAGEIPLLVTVLILLARWARQDRRDAASPTRPPSRDAYQEAIAAIRQREGTRS